jgi:hypothetical protein
MGVLGVGVHGVSLSGGSCFRCMQGGDRPEHGGRHSSSIPCDEHDSCNRGTVALFLLLLQLDTGK